MQILSTREILYEFEIIWSKVKLKTESFEINQIKQVKTDQ